MQAHWLPVRIFTQQYGYELVRMWLHAYRAYVVAPAYTRMHDKHTFVVGCSRFVVWSRKPGGQRLNDVVIVGLCASPNRAAQAWGPAVPPGVT